MAPMLRALVIHEGIHVTKMQEDSLWFQWRQTFSLLLLTDSPGMGGWLLRQAAGEGKGVGVACEGPVK